ncbi:MAG: NADH-quinone oxidoreductase subunit C [Deltaproteobacteria bacterium]|nr:NADH-quinone oxidoreductase subunit C [Deltaproteobacteria bacterium]
MLKDNITKALASLKLDQVADGDYAKTGYHLEVAARPQQMPDVAQAMLEQGCFLESLTAVDLRESFTLVYHFASYYELCRTVVHASLTKEAKGAQAPTISLVYPAANWYEREVYDLFGIKFAGHPDLKRILLPDDADFHPLLKDFGAEAAND